MTAKNARMFALLIFMLILTIVLTNCGPADAPTEHAEQQENQSSEPVTEEPQTNDSATIPALQVSGTQLQDDSGQAIQLQGLSTHGLSWFPEYVNQDMIAQTRDDWNCNVFRVAMYTDDYDGYCVSDDQNKETLKQRIDTAVQAAKDLGMYVIIDWHILSDNDPRTHQEDALAFFDEMAAKYQDETHVIYEICNEPNGDTAWDNVKEYANAVIPVIREHTDALILVVKETHRLCLWCDSWFTRSCNATNESSVLQ